MVRARTASTDGRAGTREEGGGTGEGAAVRGEVVVQLTGDVDVRSRARLESMLDELPEEPSRLVIDFTEVGFWDSTLLGFLAGINATVEPEVVELRDPPPRVHRLLELTGFTELFEVVAD